MRWLFVTNIEVMRSKLDEYYNQGTDLGKSPKKLEDAANIVMSIYLDTKDVQFVVTEMERFTRRFTKALMKEILKSKQINNSALESIVILFAATSKKISKEKIAPFILKCYDIIETLIDIKDIPSLGKLLICAIEKNISKKYDDFNLLVEKTKAKIYSLDYTKEECCSLLRITIAANNGDIYTSKYIEQIKIWAATYYLTLPKEKIKIANTNVDTTPIIVSKSTTQITNMTISKDENTKKNNLPQVETKTGNAQKLADYIKKSTDSTNNSVSSSTKEIISEIKRLNQKYDEVLNLTSINADLRVKVADLEKTNAIATNKLNEFAAKLSVAEKTIKYKDEQISEMDIKLRNAYAIDNKASSQEVQELKYKLTKNLKGCYSDWVDFSKEECSEANYASLKAIIKNTFKMLENNGIKIGDDN